MAMFMKEGETLHLPAWEYHVALVIQSLEQLALANGARLCSADRFKNDIFAAPKHGFIVNRAQDEILHELESTAKCYDDAGAEVPSSILEKIARYKNFPNEPVPIGRTVLLSTSFILNDMFYSFSMDDNPFFDCHYHKAAVFSQDGQDRCHETYAEIVPDRWYSALPLDSLVKDEIIRQTAADIYAGLMDAQPTGRVTGNRKRIRVPNIHNDGFHYETVSDSVPPLYIHYREV